MSGDTKKSPPWAGKSSISGIGQAKKIIPYHPLRVNQLQMKNQLEGVIFYGFLTKALGNSDYDSLLELLPGMFVPHKMVQESKFALCDIQVPDRAKYTVRKVKYAKREPKSERFSAAYLHAEEEVFPDEVLISSHKTQLETAPLIAVYSDSHNHIKFRAPVKGSNAYNFAKAEKIKDLAKEFSKEYDYIYFLTNTYAYNIHGTDRIEAWQQFRKDETKTMKALVRKYDVKYISIFEATEKQYPHSHNIIFSKVPLTGEMYPAKRQKKIIFGEFYNFIQKHNSSPVFDLRRACNSEISHYVIKYVAKTFSKKEQPTLDGAEKLTKVERKTLGTIIWPCIAGIRAISASQIRRPKIEKEGVSEMLEVDSRMVERHYEKVKDTRSDEERVYCAARRVADLIVFRIKKNQLCKRRVFLLGPKHITETEKATVGKGKLNRAFIFGEKRPFMKKLGCPGCMLEALNEIYWQNPEDFEKRWPCSPWYKFEKPIESSYESFIEETIDIDWDIRLSEDVYGRPTPILGRTKERARKERWEAAEVILEKKKARQGKKLEKLPLEGKLPLSLRATPVAPAAGVPPLSPQLSFSFLK